MGVVVAVEVSGNDTATSTPEELRVVEADADVSAGEVDACTELMVVSDDAEEVATEDVGAEAPGEVTVSVWGSEVAFSEISSVACSNDFASESATAVSSAPVSDTFESTGAADPALVSITDSSAACLASLSLSRRTSLAAAAGFFPSPASSSSSGPRDGPSDTGAALPSLADADDVSADAPDAPPTHVTETLVRFEAV